MKILILSIAALFMLAPPSKQAYAYFNNTGTDALGEARSTASSGELKTDTSCEGKVSNGLQVESRFVDEIIAESKTNYFLLLFSSSDEFGESFYLSAFDGVKWSEYELSRNSLDTLESFEPFATAFDGGGRFYYPTVYEALSEWDGQSEIEGGSRQLGSTKIYAIKLNLASADVLGCESFWEWME